MTIASNNYFLSPTLTRGMTELRSSFDALNRQLVTGRKAETYGGLGDQRSLSLSMRARHVELSGFRDTITDVGVRIEMMSTTLTRLDELGRDQRADTNPTESTLIGNGQTRAQLAAGTRLQEALALLNMEVAGRYLFSGRSTDTAPVVNTNTLLDGEGTRVGLRGVIAERRLADRGTVDVDLIGFDQVARLDISATSGTTFALAEDGVHPFGFKLRGGATTMVGTTLTRTAGPPASINVDVTAQPADEATIRFSLGLPDGTTEEIVLKAKTLPESPEEFAIGATTAETAANLRDVLVRKLDERSQTVLMAASSAAATASFLAGGPDTPPKRVPPPAVTATALVDATPTDTLVWYKGDDDQSISSRNTAVARIDRSVTVSYGARANEKAITRAIGAFAMLAAETFVEGDPTQAERYKALADRVREGFGVSQGLGSMTSLQTELAGSQRAMKAVDERHVVTQDLALDLIDGIERTDQEEVATALLAINTRLQASYQTTSMLSRMSLVNFL